MTELEALIGKYVLVYVVTCAAAAFAVTALVSLFVLLVTNWSDVMKVFKTKMSELFGGRKTTLSPREILFEAERDFITPRFGRWLKEVIKPTTTHGGPYVFRCEFPPKVSVAEFREEVCKGIWGDFEIKDIVISASGTGNEWIKAHVLVDLRNNDTEWLAAKMGYVQDQ